MPRPLFIICAESASVDRYSNDLSIFNVIEGIQVFSGNADGSPNKSAPADGLPFLNVRIVAVWVADDIDRPHEYEQETRVRVGNRERRPHHGTFRFTTRNHRFLVNIARFTPEPGICVVEHAIRKVGDEHWQTQQYEFEVSTAVEDAKKPEHA